MPRRRVKELRMFWPCHFHPEFGYMAPTPRFWKLARVGAIGCSIGIFAGSIGVILLAQRPEFALLRGDIAAAVGSPALFAFAPSPDRAPTPSVTGCPLQTWPYFDDKCLLGTPRTPQTFHAP